MSQNSEARRTIGDKSKTGYRGPIAEYGVTDMMDFRRWVRRTTPLVLTGALVAAGLTGCQSAQNLLPGDSALGPDQSLESVPQAPALPYEDIPQLPAPAPGVDTAATKSGPGVTPSPPEPNFEPNVDTEVEVAKPATNSTTEKVDAPVTTVEVKPTETPATATPETQPDAVASESATSDPETKPIEPVFEEPSFEKEEPVASTSDPVEKPSTATTAAPTLPLGPDLKQPSETTDPLTLPPDAGEEPLPIPKSTAPRLPNTLPRELPTEEPTPSESAPAKTTPAVTKPVTLPKKATPESLLPKEKPVGKLPVKTKPVEKLTVETEPAETKPTEPPTPADKSIPFSESGEATVPKPTGRDDKPATEPSPDESLELPEFEEPIKKTAGGDNGRPFIELPEITPGPTQPSPAETPLGSVLTLPMPDQQFESREVASIRSPDGTLPELPESRNDNPVRGVEIASFGGSADGIVFDSEGTAFVSHRDSISKVKLDGEVSHWAKTGAPRGHAILRDGTHLICDASQRAVLHLDQDGKLLRKVVTKSDGYFLRAPNDLVVDASGGFYFTDPGYARIRNAIGKVHYVAADGTVSVVAQKLAFPEGIALSAGEGKLFVAESQKNRIVEFEILSPGEVGPREVFCKLPGGEAGDSDSFVDGLAVDREGSVYVAHRGMSRVEVIGPDGDWRTSFSCPDTFVKNLAFSRDYSKLFVTGTDRNRRGGRLLIIDFAASR